MREGAGYNAETGSDAPKLGAPTREAAASSPTLFAPLNAERYSAGAQGAPGLAFSPLLPTVLRGLESQQPGGWLERDLGKFTEDASREAQRPCGRLGRREEGVIRADRGCGGGICAPGQ